MNRVEFDEKLCKGCELCVSACPKKILHLSDRTNAMGYRVAECFRPDKIAEGIISMYGLSAQQREIMSASARKAARQYDFEALGSRLMEIMYRVMRG